MFAGYETHTFTIVGMFKTGSSEYTDVIITKEGDTLASAMLAYRDAKHPILVPRYHDRFSEALSEAMSRRDLQRTIEYLSSILLQFAPLPTWTIRIIEGEWDIQIFLTAHIILNGRIMTYSRSAGVTDVFMRSGAIHGFPRMLRDTLIVFHRELGAVITGIDPNQLYEMLPPSVVKPLAGGESDV